jgi:hypothetical protein
MADLQEAISRQQSAMNLGRLLPKYNLDYQAIHSGMYYLWRRNNNR